jgi:tetratricopeptide (TPR) repeat protein
MEETAVLCQVCLSTLKAGDLYCSLCGAAVPEDPARPKLTEVRGRIAGERKYLTVLCADLQRSTDLISELDPEAAISRLEPALIAMRTAVRRNNKTWLGFAEYGLGQSYFLAGRYRDAELWLRQAGARLARAPENVPPGTTVGSLLVLCFMMRAIVYGWLGQFDEAEECFDEAGSLAKENERPYDLIAADYGRGLVQMMRGNFEEAENALGQAFRISRESEVRLFFPLVMCALGNLYSQRGLAEQARDILLQSKNEAEALGHETGKVVVSVYLASTYTQLGDVQRGLSLVRAARAGAKQKGYGGVEALAIFAEANILASQGASAEGTMACLKRTIEIADTLGARSLLAAAKAVRARALAASGQQTEAQDEMSEAIALFSQSKMTLHLERAKSAFSKLSNI